MTIGTVFINNRTQAVRLPVDVRLPEGTRKVHIRVNGHERILTPVDQTWDSFFHGGPKVSSDFMDERPAQEQSPREEL
jgi:antitoxin VapB